MNSFWLVVAYLSGTFLTVFASLEKPNEVQATPSLFSLFWLIALAFFCLFALFHLDDKMEPSVTVK